MGESRFSETGSIKTKDMYFEKPESERNDVASEQFALIRSIFSENLPVRLVGGYAEDALLEGKIEGEHHDVDLVALRNNADNLGKYFEQNGFAVMPVIEEGAEKPFKFQIERGGIKVDLAFLDYDGSRKRPYLDAEGRGGRKFRVFLDEQMFEYAPQELDGVNVRTASPLSMLQIREAILAIGRQRRDTREKDLLQQEKLKQKYFSETEPDNLIPEIIALSQQQ